MPAEPSLSFMQRHFGPSFGTKKRKTDIYLPTEGEEVMTTREYEKRQEEPKKKKKKLVDISEGSTLDKVLRGYKKVSEMGK
jgi:hypothetical protein